MTDIFAPFDLAGTQLSNRIAMAPMTRSRAPDDIANERIALYYAQRGTAGLIVSEGTPISREGQGYLFNPGIFTPAQIAGWKLTTDSVHAVGGRIFAQIWHVGRVSHTSLQHEGAAPASASSKVANGATAFGYDDEGKPGFVQTSAPRPFDTAEITRVVEDFAQAAVNAVEAGFDGVEIHGANGYLHEQFLNPLVNDRSDHYGAASIEDRVRFTLEVVDAIVARIGANRVGIRISPYGQLFDMPHYDDMDALYATLVDELGKRNIAYVHVMDQSGYIMGDTKGESFEDRLYRLLARFRQGLGSTALILAGGMTLEKAQELLDRGVIDLAAFGQPFIANPDLVDRLRNGHALATPDKATYYGGDAAGYVDYPAYSPV
jgi:2,4-dienoyl-CoA reductase-like NADH-dependent reductase (Old Yellow Enzyme family)